MNQVPTQIDMVKVKRNLDLVQTLIRNKKAELRKPHGPMTYMKQQQLECILKPRATWLYMLIAHTRGKTHLANDSLLVQEARLLQHRILFMAYEKKQDN